MNQQIRQRKLKDVDDGYTSKKPGKKGHPKKPNSLFLFFSVLFGGVTIYLVFATSILHSAIDHVALKLGYNETVYAVIIDAGSTGSRVLAYTFHKTIIGGDLVLDDELFHEIKPGLSSYVENPQMGAQSIVDLLKIAHTVVPEDFRPKTPLILRATAGLRLLEPTAAENLLQAVRDAINRSGFKVDKNAVEIMDGLDEGINSWYTVNILQDKLLTDMTSAALDLGGGSTQITYEPHGSNAPKPVIILPGPHRNISLYTYSYLNLGLNAARRGVLLAENNAAEQNVQSSCVNSIIRESKWRYANVDYYVSGSQKDIKYKLIKESQLTVSERVPVVDMNRCSLLVKDLVKKYLPPPPYPTDLTEHKINAFSYYYDRAVDAGLIDPISGGTIEVDDFIKASQRECAVANVDQPWACLDLTYIATFLQDALQLKPSTKLELVKKINGHEISWALGLAYNTITKVL